MLGLERPAVPQGCVSVLSLQAWPACHVPAVRREQRGPPRPESVPWTHKAVGPEWPWEVALCGRRPAEWPGQGRRVGQISSLHSCYCDLPAAPFPLILLPSSEATLGGGACAVCSARASASCRPAPGPRPPGRTFQAGLDLALSSAKGAMGRRQRHPSGPCLAGLLSVGVQSEPQGARASLLGGCPGSGTRVGPEHALRTVQPVCDAGWSLTGQAGGVPVAGTPVV